MPKHQQKFMIKILKNIDYYSDPITKYRDCESY